MDILRKFLFLGLYYLSDFCCDSTPRFFRQLVSWSVGHVFLFILFLLTPSLSIRMF